MRWIVMLVLFPTIALADPNPQIDRAWRGKCAACHGADGKAQTDEGKKMAIGDMSTAAWQTQMTDDKIKAAINDGVKRKKGSVAQEMEPYKGKLPPAQIDGLVAYVRALKK